MFVAYTYEDWLAAPEDKRDLIKKIIGDYKASHDFTHALIAQQYFASENTEIKNKYIVKLDSYESEVAAIDPETGKPLLDPETGKPITEKRLVKNEKKVAGTRLTSGFFFRFVTQQNQHLLANGVTLKDAKAKKMLGRAFDTTLSCMGEHALVDGVVWGFWNKDHLEEIRAAVDGRSGAVALVSEEDSTPRVLIQFWQLSDKKPQFVRVFTPEGVTMYRSDDDGQLQEHMPMQPYLITRLKDSAGVIGATASGYGALPVVPLYANPEKRSELTESIKSKIDCFDRIFSGFGDNFDMADDVYWVLNNFGGNSKDILEMLHQIHELRVVANRSDGTGGVSTAEPHTFEVPYAARQTALDILKRELYRDYMATDTEALTGGSLTNVAIRAATKDMNLKDDRYEWEVFAFVQGVLRLNGIETEDISFVRQPFENETETIENIYRAAEDLDRETRLRKNPMVSQDEIPQIMKNKAAEEATGLASVKQLQDEIDKANNPTPDDEEDEDDGTGPR